MPRRQVGRDRQRPAIGARLRDAVEQLGIEAVGGDRLHHHRDLAAAGQADLPRRVVGDAVALHLERRARDHLRGGLEDVALDAAARHRPLEPAVGVDTFGQRALVSQGRIAAVMLAGAPRVLTDGAPEVPADRETLCLERGDGHRHRRW